MDDPIRLLLILIPGLPLAACVLTAMLGPRLLRQHSHWLTILAVLASFLCSLLLIRELHYEQSVVERTAESPVAVGTAEVRRLWTWAAVGEAFQQPLQPPGENEQALVGGGMRDFRVDIVLRADSLTAMMLSMVTLISLLVAIYSAGYMQGDRGYWRFFTYFSLFVFSMTMLVSVSNFVLLYVFWEAVGLCSYLLIGFWYEKPEASAAGKKAFLVNRVGDFGFALALFLIWTSFGTLNFHDSLRDGTLEPARIEQSVAALESGESLEPASEPVAGVLGTLRLRSNDFQPPGDSRTADLTALAICLLLMLGACGKSAQFPLHVWLPDAMEGPTPVSALIHAATMVTAGVYMVVRCTPLFMQSPDAQLVVAVVGGLTAVLAALIALTQSDLKRVLAYSTISQLGYMFLALGTGTLAGITAGMFHLFTHAFFKALLFLGAGSVMHAMGNVIDMRRFGGLRRLMPLTYVTFAVGSLALAGVFPLAGFWSKDAVLGAVHDKVHEAEHHAESHARRPARPGDGRGGAAASLASGPATGTPWQLAAFAAPAAPGSSGESVPAGHGDAAAAGHGEGDHAESHRTAVFGLRPGTLARSYQILYLLGMFTSFLTAFYTFRAFCLTFHGELRVPPEAGHHAHESPRVMTAPLIVLAVCAALVGLLFDQSYLDGTNRLAQWLEFTPSLAYSAVQQTIPPGEFHLSVAGWSTLMAFGGLGLACYLYMGSRAEVARLQRFFDLQWVSGWSDVESVSRLRQSSWARAVRRAADSVRLGWLVGLLTDVLLLVVLVLAAPLLLLYYISPYKLSLHQFYFDAIYQGLFVKPLRGLARLSYGVDRWCIDGLVNLVGRMPLQLGNLMRSLQMGLVQFYALAMVLGILILIAARMLG